MAISLGMCFRIHKTSAERASFLAHALSELQQAAVRQRA